MTEKRNVLAAKCKELSLELLCMPGLAEEVRSWQEVGVTVWQCLRKRPRQKRQMCG